MAQEITQGLFNNLFQTKTPRMRSQSSSLGGLFQQQPITLGSGAMTPMSALTQRVMQSGEQLQGSIRGLFGQQKPEQAQKTAITQLIKSNPNLNLNEPEGLRRMAQQAINVPGLEMFGIKLRQQADILEEKRKIENKNRETKLPPEIQQNLFVGGKFYRTYEELEEDRKKGIVTEKEIINAFETKKSGTEAAQNARDPYVFLNKLVQSGKYTMESIGEVRKGVLQNPNNPDKWYETVDKLVYKVDPKDRRFNEEAYIKAKINVQQGNATEDQKIFVEEYEKIHPITKNEENPFKKEYLELLPKKVIDILEGDISTIDSLKEAVLLLQNKDARGNTFKDSQGKEIDGTPFSGTFAEVSQQIAKIKQKAFVSEEERLKIANTEFIQSLTAENVLQSMKLLGGNDSNEELNFMREVQGNRLTLSSLGRQKILTRLFNKLKNNYNRNVDIFKANIGQDDPLSKTYKYYDKEIGSTAKGTVYEIVEE